MVFDKTGTLSAPALALEPVADSARAALSVAAGLAAASRHPLARALVAAAGPVAAAEGVVEHPGAGLSLGEVRLGSLAFCAGGRKEGQGGFAPLDPPPGDSRPLDPLGGSVRVGGHGGRGAARAAGGDGAQ